MKERLIYSCLAPRSLPRQLKAMSFLRDVEGFSVDRLKSVRTRITTFEGRKVKVKLHCSYAHIVKCDPRPGERV